MLSRFFINRPIFAWVIALVLIVAGILSLFQLPVQQYPSIAAPKVSISTNFPGASAKTLENTVTQVIEQNLTGIDNLRYIQSQSSSSGEATITLTFEPGTDPDIAQVQTQNKLSQALPSLPQRVQQQGVSVRQAGNSYALIVAFFARDGSMSRNDISDFLSSNLEEPLSRVSGVGQIRTFGPEHAMRIWLNPVRLNEYRLTPLDVIEAVEEQNVQVAAGQLGGAPAVEGQQLNATISAQSLLETPEEFGKILLKVQPGGGHVTLADVARIEIGAESYSVIGRVNRKPASGIAIELSADANALETIQAVKDRVKDFDAIIPDELEIVYPIDISPFVEASIFEVVKTLVMAILLVVLVIYVFLQTFRATFIPAIAIPVVLLGTCAALLAVGYSINVLTLFAMVLAIGMLVDDAIVVVENVERSLEEDPSLSPRKAAFRSMKEITPALIGTTVVLWAVFLPMSLFSGSSGVIYRQFAVTIAIAMALSLFIALTLSPALCAIVLKSGKQPRQGGFFGWFNRCFHAMQQRYMGLLKRLLSQRWTLPVVFIGFVIITAVLFTRVPSAFLPEEDQGRMFALISGPVSSTLERTMETVRKVEDFYLDEVGHAVENMFAAAGFSFSGQAQNVGIAFVNMKPWEERGEEGSVFAIKEQAGKRFAQFPNAKAFPIVPPPVSSLGNASGFEFQLVDRAGLGHDALTGAMGKMLGMAGQSPLLTGVRPNVLADKPQYKLGIDHVKARAFGVPISSINQSLSAAWGSIYVNDFLEKGRIKRVFVQADAPYRMLPEDISRWYVRNEAGTMASLGEFATGSWEYGSPKLTRFNGISSREIQGSAAKGVSSGEAMAEIMRLAEQLPEGIDIAWTGTSYEEQQSGSKAPILYAISTLAVFLALAALYESWAIPLAIILIVPLGVFGAVTAAWLTGQNNDIYFQVGLLITIGLAAKNAILIVEFARHHFDEQGMRAYQAVMQAARQRLRPILMTSLTFLLGVFPLAVASGPGSGAQNAISIGVLGGLTTVTLFVIVYAPFFFLWVYRLFKAEEVRAHRAMQEGEDAD